MVSALKRKQRNNRLLSQLTESLNDGVIGSNTQAGVVENEALDP